jgi:phosphatidylglycerol:prolipoprotein diacylglycerol transferase
VADIFKIWQGGLVFYGGVFGGVVAAYPYARKHHLSFWDVLDAAAPGFPLGLIIGRIGDLIVGDHLGGASTLPFAFRPSGGVPVSIPPWPDCLSPDIVARFRLLANPHVGCHQTALYDLWNVIVLLPIVLWLMRKERPRGFMIAFTATAYGFGRFLVDFARTGTATYGGLRGTQWISLALILFGVWYTVRRARGKAFAGGPPAEPSLYAHSDAGTTTPASAATPPADSPPDD